jgi:hypothetical protein
MLVQVPKCALCRQQYTDGQVRPHDDGNLASSRGEATLLLWGQVQVQAYGRSHRQVHNDDGGLFPSSTAGWLM